MRPTQQTAARMNVLSTHIPHRIAIVGGGPAGLMAAEVARAAGCEVELYERMGSVGRKFLLAGKGGLNLTHAEHFESFVTRYRGRRAAVESWLHDFDAEALRTWARELGVETFVGTSGRVFPSDLKAAPLLRTWLRRLRAQGVRFHVHHRLTGWSARVGQCAELHFETTDGPRIARPNAVILALGGASWPQLGSDGRWSGWIAEQGLDVSPLLPANGGFDVAWSEHFRQRFTGQPVKPVLMHWQDAQGIRHQQQGELIITEHGVEGGLIYAASADLREHIAAHGTAEIRLDLFPGRSSAWLAQDLARPRKNRSIGEHLRRVLNLDGVRAGLVFECAPKADRDDPALLSMHLKSLPLRLLRTRPLQEAISTAGGIRLESLDTQLMSKRHPGLFFAGEMLDWEAPTGGYLLTASFASGVRAARGALAWTVQRL